MYLLLLEYEGECQWNFYSGRISDGQCELPWGGRNAAQTRANRSGKTARDESKEEGDVQFLCFFCHWELLHLYVRSFTSPTVFDKQKLTTFLPFCLFINYSFLFLLFSFLSFLFCYLDPFFLSFIALTSWEIECMDRIASRFCATFIYSKKKLCFL